MADGLKSFKQDWNRWSAAERTALVVVFAAAAAAALISTLPNFS